MTPATTRRLALVLALVALPFAAPGHDVTLKPLKSGSFAEMLAVRQGQPFMLVMWSAACEPCRRQFGLLRDLAQAKPRVPLVLVSTDDPTLEKSAVQALSQYGLEHEDVWIFAEPDAAKLRREIDPAWDGKLPRAYLYDASHARQVVSGPLERGRIDGWTRQVTAVH